MMNKIRKKDTGKHKRIDKILYPIVITIFVIILTIYTQNIFTQWNIITGDYENNKTIIQSMSGNMAGNLNLATRMFEDQVVESSIDVLNQIEAYYANNKEDILTKDLSEFMSPVQDLWLDITILDKDALILNEKAKVGDDSYKLTDISGARTFVNELIKKEDLSSQWITISTQTDVIIKYAYQATDDGKYYIEIAANIITYNKNIDVYDIESYANDLVSNFDFVEAAYVFNTEGISTSNYDSGNPQLISDDLKEIFDEAISKHDIAEITEKNSLGYSDTIWSIPVNVSVGDDEDVFYNYGLVLLFNNHKTMNYFYVQAVFNFLVALLAFAVIILIIMRNSSQYMSPLSNLIGSIKSASEGDYEQPAKVSGAKNMRNTIKEYNGLLGRIKEAIRTRENAYFQTINALVSAIDASDTYTAGHCTRVMEISVMLGKKLELSDDQLKTLRYGALLHDIGKIGIDTSIVNKKGKLTKDEYIKIQRHPEVGLSIISNIEYLNNAKLILDEHHERWDGKGYPHGLKGEESSILSRIVSIVDAYDAMASRRSYRDSLTKEKIVKEIVNNEGTQFDPNLTQLFLKMLVDDAGELKDRIYTDVELEVKPKGLI